MISEKIILDPPLPFLDNCTWIAVKNGDPEVVMKLLDLSEPRKVGWAEGMEASGARGCAFADEDVANGFLSRVF